MRLLPELVEPGDVVLIDGPKDFRALKLAFRLLKDGKPAAVFVHDLWLGSPARGFVDRHLPSALLSDEPRWVERYAMLDSSKPRPSAASLGRRLAYGATLGCFEAGRENYSRRLLQCSAAQGAARIRENARKILRRPRWCGRRISGRRELCLPPPSPSLPARLHRLLSPSVDEPTGREMRAWFGFAMLYAVGCALLALRQAFASKYMFADDAREHVFWMSRYLDPGLFPQDPSADYFQSLAPSGYASLYWLLAQAGIDPLLASKLIPSALSLIAGRLFLRTRLSLLPLPGRGHADRDALFQGLWLNSDLSSATPRAFFYPLFVAFLYYQVRGSILGVLVAIGLEALFFPPAVLLSLGVLALGQFALGHGLGLRVFENRAFTCFSLQRLASLFFACCPTCIMWTPLAHSSLTKRHVGCRSLVRRDGCLSSSRRGGAIGCVEMGESTTFQRVHHGFWLRFSGLCCAVSRIDFPSSKRSREARGLSRRSSEPLSRSLLVAHLLLFRLYLPNRYTQPTTRVVLMLLAGGVILALIDAALRWAERLFDQHSAAAGVSALGFSVLLLGVIAGYPLLLPMFPTGGYMKGSDLGLYDFFTRQPPTIHIASLSDEAANLPILCRRSIIISAECAVPFHPAYYLPLRDRGLQIARVQYSADPAVLQQCLRDQQVDFWVLDRNAFSPKYWRKSRLLRQLRLSVSDQSMGKAKGAMPLLQRPPPESIAYQDAHFVVLDARRLLSP